MRWRSSSRSWSNGPSLRAGWVSTRAICGTRRLGRAAHGQRRVGRGRPHLDERLVVLGRRHIRHARFGLCQRQAFDEERKLGRRRGTRGLRPGRLGRKVGLRLGLVECQRHRWRSGDRGLRSARPHRTERHRRVRPIDVRVPHRKIGERSLGLVVLRRVEREVRLGHRKRVAAMFAARLGFEAQVVALRTFHRRSALEPKRSGRTCEQQLLDFDSQLVGREPRRTIRVHTIERLQRLGQPAAAVQVAGAHERDIRAREGWRPLRRHGRDRQLFGR